MKRIDRGSRAAMTKVIAALEVELQRAALAVAREILTAELERRAHAAAAPRVRSSSSQVKRTRVPAAQQRGAMSRTSPRTRTPRSPATAAGERKHEQVAQAHVAAREQMTLALQPTPAPARGQSSAPSLPPPQEQPAEVVAERPVVSITPESAAAIPAASEPPSHVIRPTAMGRNRGRTSWTRDGIIHELASWISKGTTIDAQFMRRNGPRGLVAAARREFGRFEAAMNLASLHKARQSEYRQIPGVPNHGDVA